MKPHTQKGFSLVEMLSVLAIFAVLMSIVIFNYNKFTYETILTNMAYDVALSLREAQIYGVSVKSEGGQTPGFAVPYGIQFLGGSNSNFFLFADSDRDDTMDGQGCSEECVTAYTLQRNIQITNTRLKIGNGCPAQQNGLSIVFRRPDPEPYFSSNSNAITHAQITLTAPNGSVRYVIVSKNGQIYVSHTPLSSCQ